MRRFQPGEPIIRREIMRGEPWIAWPRICVSDEPDLLVTYLPPAGRERIGKLLDADWTEIPFTAR